MYKTMNYKINEINFKIKKSPIINTETPSNGLRKTWLVLSSRQPHTSLCILHVTVATVMG